MSESVRKRAKRGVELVRLEYSPTFSSEDTRRVRSSVILAAACVLMGAAAPVFAHNQLGGEFEASKCANMKGTLTGIDPEKPHTAEGAKAQ